VPYIESDAEGLCVDAGSSGAPPAPGVVRVSPNPDDPSLLRTNLPREYAIASEAYGWIADVVRDLARVSVEASFAGVDVNEGLLSRLGERRAH
jgi:adenosine deaminase